MTAFFEGRKYKIPYEAPYYVNGCFHTSKFYLYFESLNKGDGAKYLESLRQKDKQLEKGFISKMVR